MNTGASRISSGSPPVGMVPQGIEAIRRIEAIRPEAARSRPRGSTDDEWGRSESLDPDNVGDIADEGAGHRG
jgi:hypothetical protein